MLENSAKITPDGWSGYSSFFSGRTRVRSGLYSDGHVYTWGAQKRAFTLSNAQAVIHTCLALIDTAASNEERNS